MKRLRDNEPTVKTILDRWIRRECELTVLCTKVVGLPLVSRIEEVFDQVHGLLQFSIDRDILIKKIRMSLIRDITKNFELFPPMLTSQLTIVDKQNWAGILKSNMDSRINTVINDDQTNLWSEKTTKEIVTMVYSLILLKINLLI